MKNKDIKDMLAQYDMGLTSANEIIELFLSINDETTPSNKVNAISAAVNQERQTSGTAWEQVCYVATNDSRQRGVHRISRLTSL